MPVHRSLAALIAALVLTLTGCAAADEPEPSAKTHNEADVAFATEMMQHHAQALAMVDLTVGRELDPEVAGLAEEIRAAQGPEIEQMVDWLTEWGEPIPQTVRDHANAHGGHGEGTGMDSDMPGMMSAEDMQALEDASDGEFEERWLRMMIEHHEGAVAMARTEQQEGVFAPAVRMAEQIEKSQRAEIEQMQQLLPA